MPSDLNIVHAAQVARVLDHGSPRRGEAQGALDLVADGAVAIRDGRIVAVGPTSRVLADAGDEVPSLDASGMSVLPGLVECHSHPMFAASRHWEFVRKLQGAASAEIRAEGGGIWSAILGTRAADDQTLLDAGARAYAQILAGGVTTIEVKSGYGQNVEQELRLLRLLKASAARTEMDLVFTFLGAHVAPWDGTAPEAYARTVQHEMLPAVQRQGIAEFHDLSCEEGEFPADVAAALLAASRQAGMPTRVHADASSSSRGWTTAVEGGAVAADHLTYTPDDEIVRMGATETIAVLLPMAEQFYLDARRANARLFIECGVPVAIATDYCSSFQATSLTLSISQACSWFRLTPAEAIVGATLNAAYVLRRHHDRGSLDVGKRGDVTMLSCAHPHELGTRIGAPLVRYVIVEGRVIFENQSST
ncbi:MAG: imidazolonepropionase [Gemmatimonadaceae bacterium]